jgi:multiple sugar transport system permease protein
MASVPSTLDLDRAPTSATPTSARRFRRVPLGAILRYVLLIVLAFVFLFPFYLVVRNALMTNAELNTYDWAWWAETPQWGNFRALFESREAPMGAGLRNSAIIAVVNLVLQTLFAAMAGYALARIPVRGKGLAFAVILSTLMVPSAVTFVPSYVLIANLGMVNTIWGVLIPGLFNAFATFLFRQFYLDFPVEIEEAGRLDGLGYMGIFWRLLLPNSVGILVALGMISFINSWNAFLWPLVVGRSPNSWTAQVVLSTFLNAQAPNLPLLFTGAAVVAAPLVIVFLVMQRYIVEGVRLSGIKG